MKKSVQVQNNYYPELAAITDENCEYSLVPVSLLCPENL